MRTSRLIVILFAVGSLMASCGSSNVIIVDDILIGPEPRIVTDEATKMIFSTDLSDTSTFVIDYSFFSRQNSSYEMDSTFKDSVNLMIFKNVGWETNSFGNFQPITESFFTSSLDTLADSFHEEEDENSILWDMEMTIGIQDFPSFVELSFSGWSYTGGAHGNGYVMYDLINREDGRQLELTDAFTDVDALNAIAETYFRTLYELSPTESLNDYGFWFDNDEFTVNENFRFVGGAVEFYYNSYEIASYAGGPTELTVPMEAIKHLFKLNL